MKPERWIKFDPRELTRLEVIGAEGRRLVYYGTMKDFDLQDQGRTLKIFLGEEDRCKRCMKDKEWPTPDRKKYVCWDCPLATSA
jgi:hypothetical protein